MNYLQRIKEFAKRNINRIKANRIKKEIMKNSMDNLNCTSIGEEVIDKELIEIVLQDSTIVEKLCKDNKIIYYISSLDKDKQLEYINSHMQLFNDNDIDTISEWSLNNIAFEDLLKTNLGTIVTQKFPEECYEKIQSLDEEKLEEINSLRTTKISSLNIAKQIYESKKTGHSYTDKEMLLAENLSMKDKIEIIKAEGFEILIRDIFNFNEKDRITLIAELNLQTPPSWILEPNISDEFRNFLVSRTSEKEYATLINKVFPPEKENLQYSDVLNIRQLTSIMGEDKLFRMLNNEQTYAYCVTTKLDRNFDEEQIQFLLSPDIQKKNGMEMKFVEKQAKKGNITLDSSSSTSTKTIMELENVGRGLTDFKLYYDLRKEYIGLDYSESLYQSLFEYKEHNQLYNQIVSEFHQFSEEEKKEFGEKWNALMALDNKFGIQNIQDFKRMDEIEKEYYSKFLMQKLEPLKMKQIIFEILVRNNDIESITKLGNGTEYSMENKPLEDVVDLLSSINEIKEPEALRGILNDCIEMIGSDELKNIRSIGNNIEQKIIHEYRKGYTNAFTNYDEMSDEELSKIEGINVQRKNGVRIIELKGADFAFLAHTGSVDGGSEVCCCSQVTPENYATFKEGGLTSYVYSNFSPNRIKLINIGDAGNSEYNNTYMSSEDLQATSSWNNAYNEVRISTGKEPGDEGLRASARMIKGSVNSVEFENLFDRVSADPSSPKTIYVINEEAYAKKKEKEDVARHNQMQTYLKNLSPELLNEILVQSNGDKEMIKTLVDEVHTQISSHIDSRYKKSDLRRNSTRYWQMGRGKENRSLLTYGILGPLETELTRMDNELLAPHAIKDKVKEVSSKDDYER